MDKLNKPNRDFQMSDILVELLEVAINLILYVRNIYPDGIFERRNKYNINVMMSKHADVNAYIKDVLETLKPLLNKGLVEKLVVQISNKNEEPLERFCFEMKLFPRESNDCYFDLETHLRALLLKLNTCESMLKPLPKDCSFQILAHTKQTSLNSMEEKEDFQNFPWVVADNKNQQTVESPVIIPIRSCATEAFVIQCYVEEQETKKIEKLVQSPQ